MTRCRGEMRSRMWAVAWYGSHWQWHRAVAWGGGMGWRHGGVVAWWRGGMVAWWHGGVVGVVAWWG